MDQIFAGKRLLLIIAGGIAAYKSLDLIRRLRERGAAVRVVMTTGAQHFITPLSASSLSEDRVYTDLWSLTDENEMGHIRLSRETDLIVIAPATADLLARMAAGMADDLATTILLAADKPVMAAPSMNVMMWLNPATQANVALLKQRGILMIGPGSGDLACGEVGSGRMAEPMEIIEAIAHFFAVPGPLAGMSALVTSGPTYEAIDPVRFLGNRSSGKQGHAIAAALIQAGAQVTLISGPSYEPVPSGVTFISIETAREMLAACEAALPMDIAICAAAVSDWRVDHEAPQKIKKAGGDAPSLRLVENPDILAMLSAQDPSRRPRLVIGFAAETENVVENARRKRIRKKCDWILANDVSPLAGTFGSDKNAVHLITAEEDEYWPDLLKTEIANRLVERIARSIG